MVARTLYALLTLFILVSLTFFMMHVMPGDPFTGERKMPDQVRNNLRAKYGLDKSLSTQYFIYWKNVLTGDFGNSITYPSRSITSMIRKAWPYSMALGLRGLALGTAVGLVLGIYAALNPGKPIDAFVMMVAVLGISIPGFVVSALLQYVFGLKLGDLTVAWFGQRLFPISGWTGFRSRILPVFACSLGTVAGIARTMRTSMLDETVKDYVKTAKSKGVSMSRTVTHHLLRNSLLPIVTGFGSMIAGALTGSFIVENIFNIPGLGKLFVDCVISYDYPMIMASTIFLGALLIAGNLLVDILYGLVDPRIRLDRKAA